jgi:uncharacterized protein YcaQ
MSALDDLAHGRRELFEYWGHAACFLPTEMYPLLRWRMENQCAAWSGVGRRQRAFIDSVYAEIRDHGPLSAGELSNGGKSTGPWWGWSQGKEALELLFRQGKVAIAGRRNFERLYDLPERVLPADALRATVEPREARKSLLVRAASAMGVGAARDIAQYFHIDAWWDRLTAKGRRLPARIDELFDELVEERRLQPVRVEGWKAAAFMAPGAKIPRTMHACAIVSPFDPILWERKWTKAVFGFDYQIEIYVPAPKRVYGYYVLPFLFGDRFAARVDLKADRKSSTLLVHAAYVEPGFTTADVAAALAAELRSMARWLSLDGIVVGKKGALAAPLAKALRSRR